jgi:hypothetical protein
MPWRYTARPLGHARVVVEEEGGKVLAQLEVDLRSVGDHQKIEEGQQRWQQ